MTPSDHHSPHARRAACRVRPLDFGPGHRGRPPCGLTQNADPFGLTKCLSPAPHENTVVDGWHPECSPCDGSRTRRGRDVRGKRGWWRPHSGVRCSSLLFALPFLLSGSFWVSVKSAGEPSPQWHGSHPHEGILGGRTFRVYARPPRAVEVGNGKAITVLGLTKGWSFCPGGPPSAIARSPSGTVCACPVASPSSVTGRTGTGEGQMAEGTALHLRRTTACRSAWRPVHTGFVTGMVAWTPASCSRGRCAAVRCEIHPGMACVTYAPAGPLACVKGRRQGLGLSIAPGARLSMGDAS